MTTLESVTIEPNRALPRIILGAWQWSEGHDRSPVRRDALFPALARLADAGFDTFDCADIYTGVESLLGDFIEWHKDRSPSGAQIHVHTKFVPDLDALSTIDRAYVRRVIHRSMSRLRVDHLDLVQFAWWDYAHPRYMETAHWLQELYEEGKILALGITNFDVPRVRELLDSGFRPVVHQVQYSALDHRPENGMVDLCRKHDMHLLCYGTVAGGLLTDRFIGAPEPPEHSNRSLTKYHLIVDEFGGWTPYQQLLSLLAEIAHKHRVSLTAVAVRYVLQQPQVAAAIMGVRSDSHLSDMMATLNFQLDAEDVGRIQGIGAAASGPSGDVYDLERVRGGRHGAIMRYNLNRG